MPINTELRETARRARAEVLCWYREPDIQTSLDTRLEFMPEDTRRHLAHLSLLGMKVALRTAGAAHGVQADSPSTTFVELIGESPAPAETRWRTIQRVGAAGARPLPMFSEYHSTLAAAQRLLAQELEFEVRSLGRAPEVVLPRLGALFVPLYYVPRTHLWLPDVSHPMPGIAYEAGGAQHRIEPV